MRGCGSCFMPAGVAAARRAAVRRAALPAAAVPDGAPPHVYSYNASSSRVSAVLEKLGGDDGIRSEGIFKLGKLSPPVLHDVKPHLRVNFYGH